MSLISISGRGSGTVESVELAGATNVPLGRAMLYAPSAGSETQTEHSGDVGADESLMASVLRSRTSISVVVPVYNSQSILPELVARLEPVLASLTNRYEVVLVNDGSRDQSWVAVQELAAHHCWIRGINLMRNYGQHNALLCGIRAARFDTIVTMDDDLQHPPEEIPKLLAMLRDGFDVVYGAPEHEPHVLWRAAASKLTKLALKNVIGTKIAREVSAFRAFRTRVREAFARYQSPFVSIDVMLTWGTTRFSSVRVRHDPRHAGNSNYTFGKLVRHALTLMTGFSIWPLELASLVGFAFMVFGAGVLLYVLTTFLVWGRSVPGYAFLASSIAIFSGAQMFALGVIGEYLARMHQRLMEKPAYVVAETGATKGEPSAYAEA
jgi:glycosyltransferase involved in cell wall biosynthesis